ncbi:MAG: hypothetical protein QNJ61_15690, partial [Desulfobacterales bacterium]|nr:hypothetical protein [Desulfobacterales bacterium]
SMRLSVSIVDFFLKSVQIFFIHRSFSCTRKKTNQKKAPVPRFLLRVGQPNAEAAPHAAMQRCSACSGAHNRSIAARLASRAALPDNMMLASASGCQDRRVSEPPRLSAGSNRPTRLFRTRPRCSARGKGINGMWYQKTIGLFG